MVLQLCNNHGVQILLDIHAKCMRSNIHCLLQVGAICLQYSHDDVVGISQIFIVLLELKLQYSCIYCCIYTVLCFEG